MSKPKGLLSRNFRVFLLVVVFAAVVYLAVGNISAFGNILLVVLGFGAVVLVHEFGHFIVAKLAGVKVEVFSIFMPPILLGVRKTEDGFRFRILPKFFPKEDDESGDGLTAGKKGEASETEYRVGLIPFGGFVKMLGQDEGDSAAASDDPGSFANKPISVRMAVITAGVVFNAISAIVIFMAAFLIGIKLPPAVVGGVVPDSPAARAGLKGGDEIIEITGKKDNLDFSDIKMAAALSDRGEKVALRVRREDGAIEDFALVAEQLLGERLRAFGVIRPMSLTIEEVSDANALYESTGLLAGDRIKAVNGKDVQTHWEFEEIVRNTFMPTVTVLAERTEPVSKKTELIESQIPMSLDFEKMVVKSESDLGHIYSMVPRLRIKFVSDELVSSAGDSGLSLESGDIILAVGDIENPSYKELRDVTEAYEKKELPIRVLRRDANGVEKSLIVSVVPKSPPGVDRVMIGINVTLDAEHAVVATTIAAEDGPVRLAIPRGSVITAVEGVSVSNFYDIIREISRYPGEHITIDYRPNEQTAGDVVLDVVQEKGFVTIQSTFAEFVPFCALKKLYKASGPVDAIVMGYKKTVMFIAQTYVTLKLLVEGLVSAKDLWGPIGIMTISYHIVAKQPFVYYVYFLGLISACIAVFNFLPLPPLDGGLIALLLVEKVKGSALSERTQEIIAYTGWALIGSLFLYVTFNDIIRSFFH